MRIQRATAFIAIATYSLFFLCTLAIYSRSSARAQSQALTSDPSSTHAHVHAHDEELVVVAGKEDTTSLLGEKGWAEHRRLQSGVQSLRYPLSSLTTLPALSSDYSEFALSALIERKDNSYDLWATTILYAHKVVLTSMSAEEETFWKIDEPAAPAWRKTIAIMNQTQYDMKKGLRQVDPKFVCRIMVAVTIQGEYMYSSTESYDVPAVIVPNAAIGDENARWRHDILRCKLRNPKELYESYAGSDAFLQVELLKGDDQRSMMTYHIPWKSRVSGYMALQPDPVAHRVEKSFKDRSSKRKLSVQQQVRRNLAYQQSSLNIDPWKGYTRSPSPPSQQWDMDTVYLCVPGWLSPPSIHNLPHMLEFLQHHINQGVRHIFLGAAFSWHSPHMQVLMRSLRSFLQQEQVSISSHSGDDVDFRFSAGGAFAHTDAMKIYYSTLMLLYSKGMARYLAVWDFDEFYIPQQANQTLASFLTHLPRDTPAARHPHPFCFLELESETLFQVDRKALPKAVHDEDERVDINTAFFRRPSHIWFKNNFRVNAQRPRFLAHRKAIHPTFRLFHAGLHNGGACDLSEYYAALAQTRNASQATQTDARGTSLSPREFAWGDLCDRGHAITVDKRTQGMIYHVQFFRTSITLQPTEISSSPNRYARDLSDAVLMELHRRGLYHPLSSLHHDRYLVDSPSTHYPSHRVVFGWPEPLGDHALFPLAQLPAHGPPPPHQACEALPVLLSHGVLASARLVAVNGYSDWVLLLRYLDHPLAHLRLSHNLPYEAVEAVPASPALQGVTCHLSLPTRTLSSGTAAAWQAPAQESPRGQGREGEERPAPPAGRLYACPLPAEVTALLKAWPEDRLQVRLEAQRSQTAGGSVRESVSACFSLPAGAVGVGSMHPLPISLSPHHRAVDGDVGYLDTPLLAAQTSFVRQALLPPRGGAEGGRPDALLPLPRAHLCVAGGWGGADPAQSVTRATLAPLLEFVHHHLLLGVQRIYLPVHIPSQSLAMRRLTSALRGLVLRGQVVLWSTDTLLRTNLTSSIGSVTNGHVRYYRTHLRQQVVQECWLHAWQAGAQHLGVWDSHQMFIPALRGSEALENLYHKVGLHGWYEDQGVGKSVAEWTRLFAAWKPAASPAGDGPSSQQRGEAHVQPIAVAPMPPRDWLMNKFQSAEDYRRVWLGEIYRSDLETARGDLVLALDRGEWHQLPTEIRSAVDLLPALEALYNAGEPSAATSPRGDGQGPSLGVLLASYDLENAYHFHDRQDEQSCARLQPLLARYESIAKGDKNPFFRQMQRVWTLFCSSLTSPSPSSSSDGKDRLASSEASISNIYSRAFFPLVYAALAEEDSELFIDGWPTSPTGLVTDFSDATRNLLPYKKLYAEVMQAMTAKSATGGGAMAAIASWF